MKHDIAHEALAYLLAQQEVTERFLAETGMDLGTLRGRLADPDCLGSVLDFLLENEPVLLAFCGEVGLKPESIWKARRAYPGLKVWDSI